MEKKVKYLSLFSGIGGFELGIGERGECVGFSEIDKYAIEVYKKHFENHKNYGDITKVNEGELPDFDMLVGGFPCQAFSVAGKRRGFEDTRGTLFFDIARVLQAKKPRLLLLENVKGLLSHDNGRTFATIISTLTGLGYDLQWQVLNSKYHGVPQNRERIIIVGHTRGSARPKVFPFRETGRAIKKGLNEKNTEVEVAQTIRSRYGNGSGSHILQRPRGKNNGGIKKEAPTITGKSYQDNNYLFGTLRTYKDGQGFREMKSGVAPTIPARAREDGSGQPVIAMAVLTPSRIEKRQNGRRFKENGEAMFTINTQDRHGVYDGYSIRRLTPIECERLQGFPDNWTEGISETQRYKCLGNAVTVNVIRDVVDKLIG